MDAVIEISGSRASIDFPNKDISGDFITSQNKKYHLLADTLYSEKSDKTQECVVVFTDTEVVYCKALPSDSSVSDLCLCKVFNDGSCAFLTDDDAFIVLDTSGKQKARRKTPDGIDRIEYIGKYAWGVGFDEDGEAIIWLFSFSDMTSDKKKLPCFCVPDADVEVLELSSGDADIIRFNNHFVVGYEDGKTCAAYDFEFNPLKPSDAECEVVFSAQRRRIEEEQAERKNVVQHMRRI